MIGLVRELSRLGNKPRAPTFDEDGDAALFIMDFDTYIERRNLDDQESALDFKMALKSREPKI